MKNTVLLSLVLLTAMLSGISCNQLGDMPAPQRQGADTRKKIDFDIKVTRDGEDITHDDSRIATKSDVTAGDKLATMDKDIPFGLIGIDMNSGTLLLDNASVSSGGNGYTGYFDNALWDLPSAITLSAYYPYVDNVAYGEEYADYSIPFTASETEAGPLVSKTVERAVDQLNMIPLEFQHITNDIGFKICDVTPAKELQGLVHLRKLTATNVAQAGVFVNDLQQGRGLWHKQGYYRKIVVFEGDAKVGVGMENEKFVGYETLEDRLRDSHRYYSIPDEIEIGKQCVEVIYDVDGFTHNGFYYEPLKEQVARYMLYGLLPDNVFAYGKQYTFHIGIDLSSVYREITFAPAVGDWETKIYENNDDF